MNGPFLPRTPSQLDAALAAFWFGVRLVLLSWMSMLAASLVLVGISSEDLLFSFPGFFVFEASSESFTVSFQFLVPLVLLALLPLAALVRYRLRRG